MSRLKRVLVTGALAAFAMLPPTAAADLAKRIASATVASDEMLYELLGATEKERVIAYSIFAANPTYSLIDKVVSPSRALFGTDFEKIVALKPDLVILASFNRPELLKLFSELKTPTLILKHFDSLKDLRNNLEELAARIGAEAKGRELLSDWDKRLNAVSAKIANHKAKISVISYASDLRLLGKDTLFDSVCEAAGVNNLASASGMKGWPQVNLEHLITMNPDWIIAPLSATEMTSSQRENLLKQIQTAPGWKDLKAVKEGRVLIIPERLMFTASHHAVDLVEAVHAGIYASKP